MATENKYNIEVPGIPKDEPVILFRAQDVTTPALLEAYALFCQHVGSPREHVEHVRAIRDNFLDWQNVNRHLVKSPD